MRRFYSTLMFCLVAITSMAQGWPADYNGVMLQGFFWDSFNDTQWTRLEKQANDFAGTFDLVWIPQSGNCGGTSMGYDDLYWFSNYDSSFGNENQLRSMIQTFKAKGIGTIADVVINHRKNLSNWVDFPSETYNGETYEMKSTDICANDDKGATKEWADKNGYSLSTNNDTGEGWDGMRDLDHESENVQRIVKAYLNFLLNDLGYTGFRYDMVKGYSGSYTKIYNNDSQPSFSVGECWDGTETIRKWIDAADKTSAAFDFQFRYTVRNAINNGDWTKLGQMNDDSYPLVSKEYEKGDYRQYAVTFVENHDTEKRSNAAQDPIKKDTLAANAYLLAMPGTPCVFLTHWKAYKQEIKSMIAVRKLAGITNTSSYTNMRSNKDYYANVIKVGDENRLLVVVGKNTNGYEPSASQWQEVLSGYKYKYFLPRTMETAFVDMVSGEFDEAFKAKLIAVSADDDAKLVYTLDGTDPTASSTKVDNGTSIDITEDCTLKVALLVGGVVKGMVTHDYTFNKQEKREITVYVNVDNVNWNYVNFWSWGGDGSHAPTSSNWPGDKVTEKVSQGGKDWFCKKFTINGDDDDVSLVFSTGSGSPQTVDVTNVSQTSYFEILTEKDSEGKYKVKDVTSSHTGIRSINADVQESTKVYTLDGRLVRTAPKGSDALSGLAKGIYIVNKKKFILN